MLKSLIAKFTRKILHAMGYDIINQSNYDVIEKSRFGYDPFLDIQRLSLVWKLPVLSFFDVGANDGSTSAAALKYFPSMRVFAFEPHPLTFEKLKNEMQDRSCFIAYNL